jgi:class 3 adenylate cyclase/tetratricopeptide (TPR) repeat protein
MRCWNCGAENPEGLKFCNECATPFAKKQTKACPTCKFENPPTAKFCGECAAPLSEISPSHTSHGTYHTIQIPIDANSEKIADGERKVVTALFADITGSTALMESLDPEDARAVIDPAIKLMAEAVQHYEGYIVQSTGDGIFALFGAPVAREDHAQRAIYAALRMQEEVRRYGARLQLEGRAPVEIRVGASTGEVIVRTITTGKGHAEYAPIGHTANLASRLQSIARGGSVAVSESTRRLVEGYFILKALGESRLKGIAEPVQVYEVGGLGPLRTKLQRAAQRGLTRFVGREHEMAALKRGAGLVQRGHGQVVAIVGDAGTGKSRLVYEFKATSASGWMVLEAFSVSHGRASAYLPVVDLLHAYFRFDIGDDQRTRREKVTGRMLALDRSLEDALPYLFGLLGLMEGDDPLAQMDPQLRRRRTLDAIKRMLMRESINQPLMLIFEDLHWIDEETQALLNLLADSVGTAKILLLVNYRPEYSHSWINKTYYTQLRLDPFSKDTAGEMLSAMLGDGNELRPIKQLIAERTEGNPFFMEEMVQSLFEAGVLVGNGKIKLAEQMSEIKLPLTVQGVLASRIDRLPITQREFLHTLAVIGKQFPVSLVKRVVIKPEDELDQMLDELQLAEFMYEQPAPSEAEYTFKHALTHEVAYNSVLVERRKAIHQRVGAAIEELYASRLEEHLSELAYHYKQARDIAKAAHFLKRAAEQNAARSALAEAEGQLRDAVGCVAALPPSSERDVLELGIQTTLASLLIGKSFGAQEREEPLRRAHELCERVSDPQLVLPALFQIDQLYIQRMRLGEARALADRALELAQSSNDPVLQAGAWCNVAESSLWSGYLEKARVHAQRTFALFEHISAHELIRAYGVDYWLAPCFFLALIELLLGRPEQGLQWEARTLERATGSSHPYSKALGLVCANFGPPLRGDFGLTAIRAAAALQVSEELGFRECAGWAKTFSGWVSCRQGERASGIATITEANLELAAVGSFLWSTWRSIALVEGQTELGRWNKAEAAVAEAFENLERKEERWCEAEVYRTAAEVQLRKPDGNIDAAEQSLHRAIEIARSQHAKWWELRATVSLARLLQATHRKDEAQAMLANIYNWFTEGFDTADLKDAKALLEELAT